MAQVARRENRFYQPGVGVDARTGLTYDGVNIDFRTGQMVSQRATDVLFWEDTLAVSVSGLELVLRRLGLELEALAHPGNRGLAQALATRSPRAPRRPK